MRDILVNERIEVDFIIALNGAAALNEDGSYIWCERAENKNNAVREIAEYLRDNYGAFLSCLLQRERVERVTFKPADDEAENAEIYKKADNIKRFTHLNSVVATDEDAEKAVREINLRWGFAVNALQNGRCIDIPPCGIDKGQGVAAYARIMDVPKEYIYCVGDNMNDMAMISRFHGCAVANAKDEIKKAAEGTYDGVWAVIDHIMGLE